MTYGSPLSSETSLTDFRKELLTWYGRVQRRLPWRENRDPYRVWVSEIMLQQTTVKTVLPYFERFLGDFPTLTDLARASLDQVLSRWSGLGYYSRARNLHEAAGRIVRDHGGIFPAAREDALALPGIGPYTAAAILSIAHGAPLAVLDGNVSRVLARILALRGPIKSSAVRKRLWTSAAEFLDPEVPGDFNQAMMELGATICTPKSPRCAECPVTAWCEARRVGLVEVLPETTPPPAARPEIMTVAVIGIRGRILFRRRPANEGLMPGLWELPALVREVSTLNPAAKKTSHAELERESAARLGDWILTEFGEPAREIVSVGAARHAIMNRRIRLHVFRVRPAVAPPTSESQRWFRPGEVEGLATSSIVKKALRLALG